MPSQLTNGYFNFISDWYSLQRFRGCSSEVEHQLPKLRTRVRFPSPAQQNKTGAHAAEKFASHMVQEYFAKVSVWSPARSVAKMFCPE